MRLVIQGAELTVTLKSDKELDTKQIVMAHQLATGNYEALFVEQEEVTSLEPITDNALSELDNKRTHFLEHGEQVKVQVMCPFCGHVGKTTGRWGFSFTKCPKCEEKLFNAYATGVPAEPDAGGYIFHCQEPIKFKGRDDDLAEAFGV